MTERIIKNRNAVLWLADNYGWDFFDEKPDSFMVRFRKDEYVINVYLSKMTVNIVWKGKNFFFKKCSVTEIELKLMNPQKYLIR